MKLEISLSAVPLGIVKNMMRKIPSNARRAYDAIFNKYGEGKRTNKDRIYFPLDEKSLRPKKVVPPAEILEYLASINFTLNDYLLGTATMPDGKRTVRLGKVLTKKPDLLKRFENDPQRKLSKHEVFWVVISRHPYDILGMSFDRGWTSCMNVKEGENKHYLKGDLKLGTLVAYLVKDTDRNINNPTSRIAIRPYFKGKDIYLVPSNTYGTASDAFQKVVRNFCDMTNEHAPKGKYVLPDELYDDDGTTVIFNVDASIIPEMSEEDCIDLVRQGHLAPDVLDAMIDRNDPDITRAIVNRHSVSLSEETLLKIVNNPENERAASALFRRFKRLPFSIQMWFANSPDEDTQDAVAGETDNVQILLMLANSPIKEVRYSVARNAASNGVILKKLADDESIGVKRGVVLNSNTKGDLIRYIVTQYPDVSLIRAALEYRPDIGMDFFGPLIEAHLNNEEMCESASSRTDISSELIDKIYAQAVKNYDDWNDAQSTLDELAVNANTSHDTLIKIISDSKFANVRGFLRRNDLTLEMVEAVWKHNTDSIQLARKLLKMLGDKPSPDLIRQMLSSSEENVVFNALDNEEYLTPEMEDYFIEKGDPKMVKDAAESFSPSTHLSLLTKIAERSTNAKALGALADYNRATLPASLILAFAKNPAVQALPKVLYALYARVIENDMTELEPQFASIKDELNVFAEQEGRYSIDELRENHEKRKRR